MLHLVSILVAGLASTASSNPLPQAPPTVPADCAIVAKAFPTVFNATLNCCDNSAASCDGNNRVTSLQLFGKNLQGTFPDISGLTNLQSLTISMNGFNGTLPDSFGKLSQLQYLSAYMNQFSGPVPSALSSLTNIQSIDMGYNSLTSIPDIFGSLTNLQSLQLHNNQLTGTLPPSLFHLPNLNSLVVSTNGLSGDVGADNSTFPKLTSFNYESSGLNVVDPLKSRVNLPPPPCDPTKQDCNPPPPPTCDPESDDCHPPCYPYCSTGGPGM